MKHLANCFSKAIAFTIVLTISLNPFSLSAFDYNDDKQQRYIETYSKIAIEEMHRSKIPASITLAQGILESQWGEGGLATQSKNHFGIKCKSEWQGEKHFYKDDDRDENGNLIPSCFRVYDRVEDSYIDHTNFLVERERYKDLFSLGSTNYKEWAHGLKRCGYATDPGYGRKLIKIIETYSLFVYDEEVESEMIAQSPFESIEEPVNTSIESPAFDHVDLILPLMESIEHSETEVTSENTLELPIESTNTNIELPAFNDIDHAAPGIENIENKPVVPAPVFSSSINFGNKMEQLPTNSSSQNILTMISPEITEIVSSGGRIQAIERKSSVKIRRR